MKPGNSTVGFFLNPPKGAEDGQKFIESKIQENNYFKNFSKVAILMLDRNKTKGTLVHERE